MDLLRRIAAMGEHPRWLLSRCLLLSLTMLTGALVLVVRAGERTVSTYLLHEYAASLASGALILFAAGLIGSALAEDVLRSRGL